MDDRTLLELAAKASGRIGWTINAELSGPQLTIWDMPDGACTAWRPLHDDGDALRLAVKLGLTVEIAPEHGFALARARNRITRMAAER